MTTRIKFEPMLERPHPLGGVQRVYRFPNGFGASVIRAPFSYGNEEGLWELGVLKFNEDGSNWSLCYDTRITDDVEGRLSDEAVEKLLKRIKRLKKRR